MPSSAIYMHWGPFSVPAFETEWYPRWMYVEGHKINKYHLKTWGTLDKFGYKDFIPLLTAEKFDAGKYAALFKEAGAEYVAAAAIHHDGFAMWDSHVIPNYNARKMGPKRGIVAEIVGAARMGGLKAGVSTHYGRHWAYYTFRENCDTWNPKYAELYGRRRGDEEPPKPEDASHWKDVLVELIDKYQPDYIFVDGGITDAKRRFQAPWFSDAFREVVAYYYNRSRVWGKDVVITYKRKALLPDEAVEDFERAGENKIRKTKWQSDDKLSITGWCYVSTSGFWPTGLLIEHLLDIVSKNGNLLLSIGPKPDGTLRAQEVRGLKGIGAWLKVNGEAVYGSRPWRVFGEGGQVPYVADDYKPRKESKRKQRMAPKAVRFTRKAGAVYATVFHWPDSGGFTIKSITDSKPVGQSGIKSISMLGSSERLEWKLTGGGLEVQFPANKPCDFAYVLKIVPAGQLLLE